MIHGPCGPLNLTAPCMKDGKCTKRYPRPFRETTSTAEDGYPHYRRRSPFQGGISGTILSHGRVIDIDNRWVVPYSPALSRALEAHVNVEFCCSVKSIKYICKYITKGSDQAILQVQNKDDEIEHYMTGRYICSSEAVWRILGFSIHDRYSAVTHLDVHLENNQRVSFTPRTVIDAVANPRTTILLAVFKLCQTDSFAQTLLYADVPTHYTFNKQRGEFIRRMSGSSNTIGRVYSIHPNNNECFYLRVLLHKVKEPKSFNDLKTFDGICFPTFQEACIARGLIESDEVWRDTLQEASTFCSSKSLRRLVAVILVFCKPSNPKALESYKSCMSNDISRRLTARGAPVIDEIIHNQCLHSIQESVLSIGGSDLSVFGLPSPSTPLVLNIEYLRETNYDPRELQSFIESVEPSLTEEQRLVTHQVLNTLDRGTMFFLDAPGGTGKTFTIKLLLAHVRAQGRIIVSCGLFRYHSYTLTWRKNSPLYVQNSCRHRTETPLCSLSKQSNMAQVIRDCSLIIWDECSMAHRKSVEAVDRTLRDFRNSSKPFGGVTVLFAGDFRQTLPVVVRGTRADEVEASLEKSHLWPSIETLTLTKNMRAHLGGDVDSRFATALMAIGNGSYGT